MTEAVWFWTGGYVVCMIIQLVFINDLRRMMRVKHSTVTVFSILWPLVALVILYWLWRKR